MFYKKIVSVFVSSIIMLSCIILPKAVVNAEPDVTPPVVNSVSIDKTSVYAGDIVTITANVQDDSAIQYVIAYYKTPITGKDRSISLRLTNGVYKGEIAITDADETGTWTLRTIQVMDVQGNFKSIYPSSMLDFIKCSFEVSGTRPDVTPPVVNNIGIDKTSAYSGDIVTITANVQDDSAIQYVIAYYKTPITGKDRSVSLSLTNGVYKGEIAITDADETGTWTLRTIQVMDVQGNFKSIYSSSTLDFTNCSFKVSGTKPDVTPPVINSISIDKTSVYAGDIVTITANVQDDSAIQYVIAYYKTPITCKDRSISLRLTNGVYKGEIAITDADETGTWTLRTIQVMDVQGNFKSIYSSSMLDFTNCSFEANVFISIMGISIDKPEASLKVGETTSLIATTNPLNATNKNVVWESSDTSVATVDNIGKVTAVSAGTAVITVTSVDGHYTASCTITVVNLLKEDVNKDGVIDIKDIALIASAYDYESDNNNWNADYDINNDCIIDLYDLVLVSKLLE